jgi:hypothetical protein
METSMRALILSVTLMSASPAFAFLTQNNERVQGSGSGQFEVLASPGQAASASWCAAGDYVIHGLGMARDTRIWRVTAPPRKAGEGVGFALSPEGAQKTGLLSFGQQDNSLSAAAAEALCYGEKADFQDLD